MNVKITYPMPEKRRLILKKILQAARWTAVFAAYLCPIINLVTGGKAWSLTVLAALYMVWTLVLSPDLVEYNRISQFIKLALCTALLFLAIGVFLPAAAAVEAVSIVGFCGVGISGVLFFTDLERQKQNMFPMLLFTFLAALGAFIGLCIWREESRWALAVMGAFGTALLFICIKVLGNDFVRELKRRFHTR